MSFTNKAGKTPQAQDSSFISIFQNFLVNKIDSPPPDYLSESEDDAQAPPLPTSVVRNRSGNSSESGKESYKARPVEVAKLFNNEVERQKQQDMNTNPKIAKDESVKSGPKKKKKFKKNTTTTKTVLSPVRTSARRKAMNQTTSKVTDILEEDDLVEKTDSDFDLSDSDADPAWSPMKENSDNERNRRRGSRRKRHISPPSMSSESEEEPQAKQQKVTTNFNAKTEITKSVQNQVPQVPAVADKPRETASIAPSKFTNQGNLLSPSTDVVSGLDFKPGEFVVMKEDLDRENPPLWRLDGKTLLQKYEAFYKSGEKLYRNLTTFSGWTSLSRPRFLKAPVQFRVQSRKEIIIEFDQEMLSLDKRDFADEISQDLEPLQETYEVYIQTLISHVLDGNFLPEIFREKDEFFLSKMKIVDELGEKRKSQLVTMSGWKEEVLAVVDTWPSFELTVNAVGYKNKDCAACKKTNARALMELDGEPYDKATLKSCPIFPKGSKSILLCLQCFNRMQLYHKVTHMKQMTFVECAKQVSVIRNDKGQNTTTILDDMLTNEVWMNQIVASIKEPLKTIDQLDVKSIKRIVAEKYRANKPTQI